MTEGAKAYVRLATKFVEDPFFLEADNDFVCLEVNISAIVHELVEHGLSLLVPVAGQFKCEQPVEVVCHD